MAILNVNDFWAGVHDGDRVMALDVGSKTIGLATAVWGSELIMPLKTIWRVKFTADATEIVAVIRDYDIRALVVGWPLLSDGRPGKRCQSVRDFTAELDRFLMGVLPLKGVRERVRTNLILPLKEGGAPPERGGGGDNPHISNITPSVALEGDTSPFQEEDRSRIFPITFWDERFSTAQGDEIVGTIGKTAGKSVNKNRDDIIDSLAAQKILQDFMFNNGV